VPSGRRHRKRLADDGVGTEEQLDTTAADLRAFGEGGAADRVGNGAVGGAGDAGRPLAVDRTGDTAGGELDGEGAGVFGDFAARDFVRRGVPLVVEANTEIDAADDFAGADVEVAEFAIRQRDADGAGA